MHHHTSCTQTSFPSCKNHLMCVRPSNSRSTFTLINSPPPLFSLSTFFLMCLCGFPKHISIWFSRAIYATNIANSFYFSMEILIPSIYNGPIQKGYVMDWFIPSRYCMRKNLSFERCSMRMCSKAVVQRKVRTGSHFGLSIYASFWTWPLPYIYVHDVVVT